MPNEVRPLSPETVQKLMDAGLSKQQAQSATARACAEVFMPDEGKALLQEAWLQANAARKLVVEMREKQAALSEKIESLGAIMTEIANAQAEYGIETLDIKAKNALCMYSAILIMNKSIGVTGVDSVDAASYDVYAYLGGQAKREITLNDERFNRFDERR